MNRVTVCVLVCVLSGLAEVRADEDIVVRLTEGERYEAVVPLTLDLAERGRVSVQALTSFLSAEADYSPYGHAFFNRNPPYMSSIARGTPNWGKIAQSLILTRLMCGSDANEEIDQLMVRGMLKRVELNPVAPTPVSRVMLALIDLYQISPSPALRRIINQMADAHVQAAQRNEWGASLRYAQRREPECHRRARMLAAGVHQWLCHSQHGPVVGD